MDVRGDAGSRAREFPGDLKQWPAIPPVSGDPGAPGYPREEPAATGPGLR